MGTYLLIWYWVTMCIRYPSPLARISIRISVVNYYYSFADVLPLRVQDNKILIGDNPGSLVGVSLFWSNSGWGGERFYNKKVVNFLKTEWNASLIRAAMGVEEGGGYLQDAENNKARLKAVVDAAIEADMYVIIDWHSHYASQHADEAKAFFEEMAKTYGGNNHVIYEVWNEPKDDASWKDNVKPYAQAVIEKIRAFDKKNLILVGSPRWSQDVDIATSEPIQGYENIAYALHFYAGTHGQDLRNKATKALDNNCALFISEWGSVNADGNGNVATNEADNWIKFMKENGISSAYWSLNDKQEGASVLKPGASSEGGWTDTDLTESGKYIRDVIKKWYQ